MKTSKSFKSNTESKDKITNTIKNFGIVTTIFFAVTTILCSLATSYLFPEIDKTTALIILLVFAGSYLILCIPFIIIISKMTFRLYSDTYKDTLGIIPEVSDLKLGSIIIINNVECEVAKFCYKDHRSRILSGKHLSGKYLVTEKGLELITKQDLKKVL